VGGANYIQCTFSLLEQLCSVEDFLVRQNAINSLNKLIFQLPNPAVSAYCFDIVKRLGGGEWYAMKCSACNLSSSIYKNCSELQKDELIRFYLLLKILSFLFRLFSALCGDEVPMVRRAAAANIKVYFIFVFLFTLCRF
jgi:serine/threonine-protein phosphatase 2A regulatory subunit A